MSIHMSESKDARAKLQNELQETQKSSLAALDQLESNAKISRLQHAVAWLAVDNRTQQENFERFSNRHDETCVWIARNGHFISWCIDDGKNPVLWLSGKPGAGKSITLLIGSYPNHHCREKCDLFLHTSIVGRQVSCVLLLLQQCRGRQHLWPSSAHCRTSVAEKKRGSCFTGYKSIRVPGFQLQPGSVEKSLASNARGYKIDQDRNRWPR